MSSIAQLSTPALLLDLDKLEDNIRAMARRTARLGVRLRPHVKTHKCPDVGNRQIEHGAQGITVSTLPEARAFADAGFTDITWALPLGIPDLTEIRQIARTTSLRLLVDSAPAVDALERAGDRFDVWLKVDCGYHRAGVDPESEEALALARRLAASPTLHFDGLLTHSGHAYDAKTRDELERVARQERDVMVGFSRRLRAEGIQVEVSIGSTPAMSVAEDLTGITEARPGNYVFYDYTQTVLGSCSVGDCAVTVLASVISSPAGSDHSVVDAGALALSKDSAPSWSLPTTMGEVFDDYDSGSLSPTLRLRSLSQEHGVLSERLPLGSQVRILPNHSCLAVACFDRYHVVRGDEVIDEWAIHRDR